MTERLILDCEVYQDYFLLSFMSTESEKVRSFEMFEGHELDTTTIIKLMRGYTTVSFNGLSYDLPIITAAVSGFDNARIKKLSDAIIQTNLPSYKICSAQGISVPKDWGHIDIIDVLPGQAGLKIYGGRLGAKKMQDLPYSPSDSITPDMRESLRDYCTNDLETTRLLYNTMLEQIALREKMSEQYKVDLRSKSDAQIAETIIVSELSALTGKRYRKPEYEDGHVFRYIKPDIVSFESEYLNSLLSKLTNEKFTVSGNGAVKLPEWMKEKIVIDNVPYQMGIGGLHSCEKSQFVASDDNTLLADFDVAGYYPNIILQQRLFPKLMGRDFLRLYQSIVDRRMKAKRTGDKVSADTLKICVNGSFGKLGSKYSALYAPELLIQTTISGQLILLMLIERLTNIGTKIISANTDGIVVKFPKLLEAEVESVNWEWMLDTSFELERTDYSCIASRDVNNYCAVKMNGEVKVKGCFAKSGIAKNPDRSIIYRAVTQHISKGIPVEKTIRECADTNMFVTVRRVDGGATWRGQYLGKAVRFYSSKNISRDECIHYDKNSNRVPNSAGCKPIMVLPDTLPDDIDYEIYITEAKSLLSEVGL